MKLTTHITYNKIIKRLTSKKGLAAVKQEMEKNMSKELAKKGTSFQHPSYTPSNQKIEKSYHPSPTPSPTTTQQLPPLHRRPQEIKNKIPANYSAGEDTSTPPMPLITQEKFKNNLARLQEIMAQENKSHEDKKNMKIIYKEIKEYFQKNKNRHVEEYEKEFVKMAKIYVEIIKGDLTTESMITKDEIEYNRMYGDNDHGSNSDNDLKALLKEEIKQRFPKTQNLITKAACKEKSDHYKQYLTLLEEKTDLTDKALIELARKVKLIKYEEAIDIYKMKDLGDIKMNKTVYKESLGAVVDDEKRNNIKLMIMEQIEKGNIIGGIIKINNNNTLVLSGEHKHIMVGVEDKDNSDNVIIICMLTSEKDGTIELTKTQPLNKNDKDGDNKPQMVRINKQLVRIAKKDIEERENVVEYIKHYTEEGEKESVYEKFKKGIAAKVENFSEREIQDGIIEIDRQDFIDKLKDAINIYINNIDHIGENINHNIDKKVINDKATKIKDRETNDHLPKEIKYINDLISESTNRQDIEEKLQNYLDNINKSSKYKNKDETDQ